MSQETAVRSAKPVVSPLVAIIGALVLAGGAAFWYLERAGAPSQTGPVLTPEAKAYVKNLKLSDVQIKAAESYMKQTIVEITGKITNAGDRAVNLVEINCIFYDAYGQLVLRERVAIVKLKSGGLKPGETKDFRLPFDNLPGSWNQGAPQLAIAQIIFG